MRKLFKELLKEINWTDRNNRGGIDTFNDAVEFYEFIVRKILDEIKNTDDESFSDRILVTGNIA